MYIVLRVRIFTAHGHGGGAEWGLHALFRDIWGEKHICACNQVELLMKYDTAIFAIGRPRSLLVFLLRMSVKSSRAINGVILCYC